MIIMLLLLKSVGGWEKRPCGSGAAKLEGKTTMNSQNQQNLIFLRKDND